MPIPPFDPVSVPVADASHVGDARRTAVALAAGLCFGDADRGRVALVVTEAATNLARHARGGELVFRSLHDQAAGGDHAGLEVLAIDRGPGMADPAVSLRDGHSTGTTPGTGLGAIARGSQTFDLHTGPGGTVLLSRLWPDPPPAPGWAVGVVCLPVAGEVACGDGWDVEVMADGTTRVLVVDGLGHGLHAADAARMAIRTCRDHRYDDGPGVVAAMHAALRSTRGAAVAVADVPAGPGTLRFTGVGNCAAQIIGPGGTRRGLVSHNGTAGAAAHRIQPFAYPWAPADLLIVHSDGLGSQWHLDRYPGLRDRHPAVVAGVLYRDFRRDRDDCTVLVLGRP